MIANETLPPIGERTLSMAFARALDCVPDKVAYIDDQGDQWSYHATHQAALKLAGGVAATGVGWQQPLGAMLDNSMDFLHLAFGLGLSGRIQVPINTAYKGDFLAHIINDSGIEVLVLEAQYLPRVTAISEHLHHLKRLIVRGDAAMSKGSGFDVLPFAFLSQGAAFEPSAVSVSAGDLMAYMYTSGTTGLSKGVEVTHAHAYTYASREDAAWPRADDRMLVTLPLFHLAGQWYGAYQSLIAQATCVIQPGFSASKFWDLVRAQGITAVLMLGAMAEILQQAEPHADDADNPVEHAVMAPLASDFKGFQKRFGVKLSAVYGMSEIGAVMFTDWPDAVAGEAGRTRSGYELRVVDEGGIDVPADVPGELWVRGESPLVTLRGYHGLPEKTAEIMAGGWVHTGDMFRRDAAGHYYFVDRRKDALRRRGENVSSFEVERVLNQYPTVRESAVVAVPSSISEDDIKAVLVPRDGKAIDFPELVRFLQDRMPYFMVPRYFEIVDSLPRTPTQKVRKNLLRDAGVTAQTWDREAAGIKVGRSS